MENKYLYIGKGVNSGSIALFYKEKHCITLESKSWATDYGMNHKAADESYFENITADYLRNTKIRVESHEHSEFVQKLVFSAGGKWIDDFEGQQVIQFLEKPFIVVDGNLQIAHLEGLREDLFIESNNKEIKLPMPPSQLPEVSSETPMPKVKPPKQASDEWPKVGDEVMCFNYEENKYLKVKVLDAKTKSDEFAVASITDKGLYGTLWWGCNFKQLPTPQEKLTNEIYNQIGSKDDSYALAKAILAGEIEGLVYRGD